MLNKDQEMLVDNIIEDLKELEGERWNKIRDKLESRIESYDSERREQIIRDLSASLPRIVSEVI